ncbi:MAG TPA: hypothetical protein VIL30_20320 [Ramlibacter sp.]|jgi:hypothetical protein
MNQEQFRAYFKEDAGDGQDRWSKAISNLNESSLQELIVGLEIFREEVAYVLNNTHIGSPKAFAYLKALSFQLHSTRGTASLDYDSSKQMAGFYWQLLSGWDWATGYPKDDVVERMIGAI